MCITLTFFPFLIFLLVICTIPSLENVLSIRPIRFNSRQWNAIFLLFGVKFSFMNIPCNFSRPIDVLSMFFRPFLLTRTFFACFLLANCTIVVFEEFFDFPIRWQGSTFLLDTFKSILSKISIIFSSSFWSSTSSGIPVISRLFLRPYCSRELLFSSSEISFFSRLIIILRNLWFQPVDLLWSHPSNLTFLYLNYQNVATTCSRGW